MDRRQWQIDYLERTHALHATTVSGPKRLPGGRKEKEREAGEPSVIYNQRPVAQLYDNPDLETTIGNLRHIATVGAASAVAQIILKTEFLYIDAFILQIAGADVALYGRLRDAVIAADDTLWESWVKRSFPNVTRLPTGTSTWRELVRRIVRLVCTTRIHAYWIPTESKVLSRVGDWPGFRLSAKDAAIKCDVPFGHGYNEYSNDDYVGISGTDLYLQIDSEKYRKQYQQEYGSWDARFPNGRPIEGFWISTYRAKDPPDQRLQCLVCGRIGPQMFVCDNLFNAIAVERDNQSVFPGSHPSSAATILEQLLFPRWGE